MALDAYYVLFWLPVVIAANEELDVVWQCRDREFPGDLKSGKTPHMPPPPPRRRPAIFYFRRHRYRIGASAWHMAHGTHGTEVSHHIIPTT